MKAFEQDNHKHGPQKNVPARTIPNYIKYFVILSSLVLTGYVVILAQSVVGPLLAAFIVSLLLKPLSQKFELVRMPRSISSLFAMFIVFIVIVGLSTFFSTQIANIASEMNSIESQFNSMIDKGHKWTENTFGIAASEQTTYLKQSLGKLLENSSSIATSTISATANFFTGFFLFLISLFFFLYYRSFLVSFLYRVFSHKNHGQLGVTLKKVEGVVRNYILGLFAVILIIAVLNTVGLLALGIKHAVFFGALSAILTIIPYAGVMLGSLLPAIFALVTKDSLWYPVGVIGIFAVVQFLEGNFITPNIVGNQVSVNPFAAIVGLLVGGMMLGATGMIFAIPLLAIVKVICDSIEETRPIGYLIGSPPDDEELYEKRRKRAQRMFGNKA
ncbi:AI-2E family transporter [Owenweeksia hongkongensis]|uniref:AI-2E family transporter n=1 Tax=Owenweeksia hongkongensis TaxID=253245 RepID=UPI003A8D3962